MFTWFKTLVGKDEVYSGESQSEAFSRARYERVNRQNVVGTNVTVLKNDETVYSHQVRDKKKFKAYILTNSEKYTQSGRRKALKHYEVE